jgi:hypothetical protein
MIPRAVLNCSIFANTDPVDFNQIIAATPPTNAHGKKNEINEKERETRFPGSPVSLL